MIQKKSALFDVHNKLMIQKKSALFDVHNK